MVSEFQTQFGNIVCNVLDPRETKNFKLLVCTESIIAKNDSVDESK